MAIKGIFTSHQGIVGERSGDFASSILYYYPTGQAQMFAISAGIPTVGAGDTTFHWYEDSHISGRQPIASGGTTTSIVVTDGSFYVPNQILLVEETGEYVFTTQVSGNTLTVIRGLGGTAIVSVTNSMHLQLIGNAHEEASEKPVAVTQQGAPRSNLVQIWRNAWAISGTAKAVKYRTGDKLAKSKRECAMYHSEDMERSMLWGKKHLGTLNGNQFRLTDGVVTQIESYGGVVASAATDSGSGPVAGDLSLKDLTEFVRQVFSTSVKGQPNERIVYNGDIVLQALQHMTLADSVYNIEFAESSVGIKVGSLVTAFGTLKLLTHPMMNESPVWRNEMYVLHPGGLRKRMLRDTFEDDYDKSGSRANGIDADEGMMTTEGGMEVGGARTMGIYRNIQRGVKSDFT
jgi:hypothetical protein